MSYDWRANLTPYWQNFWAKMDRRAAGLPDEAETLGNDDRLAHWIERAGHAVGRRIDREVRSLGLGATQAALLLELEGLRYPTHELCARRMRVSRAVVTRLLANLEMLGLVALTPHPSDRRLRVPSLTAVGASKLEAVRAALGVVEDAIGQDLTADERVLLRDLLARVDETTTRWS